MASVQNGHNRQLMVFGSIVQDLVCYSKIKIYEYLRIEYFN